MSAPCGCSIKHLECNWDAGHGHCAPHVDASACQYNAVVAERDMHLATANKIEQANHRLCAQLATLTTDLRTCRALLADTKPYLLNAPWEGALVVFDKINAILKETP